jgi:type II secretory pathway pseudopilin PulG
MKQLRKIIRKRQNGFSTLEALIAIAILAFCISAATMLAFGAQSYAVDTGTNIDALAMVLGSLEDARATAAGNFASVVSSSTVGSPYSSSLTITNNGQCEKWAVATTTWNTGRSQTVELVTNLIDPALAIALGGDCGAPPGGSPPGTGGCPTCPTWRKPRLFASYKFNPGQPVALDILERIAYVSDNKNKLNIVDTSGATLGFSGDFLSPSYDAGRQLNDLDVIKWIDPLTGTAKKYLFAARGHDSCDSGDTSDQLQVFDVTTPTAPSLQQSLTLAGSMPPSGSCPGGWRVYYFDKYVYTTTRFTAGHEFHVFNANNPVSLSETGSLQASTTINDFFVTSTILNGVKHTIAYVAASASKREVMMIDATNPNMPYVVGSLDLADSGTEPDGVSIYSIGMLYIGRQVSSVTAELLAYRIAYETDPGNGKFVVKLTHLGGGEIGADIDALRVFNKFAFIGTAVSNDEFQVWDISTPASISRIDTSPINFPNKVSGGLDYEDPYIYALSLANDPLQILYSAP